jgi:hypothetical protein
MLALVAIDACEGSTTAPTVVQTIETDNPTVPVGDDAYLLWSRWPYLRLATRTYLRSTYDRSGGNEGADAAHYLRLGATLATAFDVAGPGVLYFTRANHWHGSPWHYVVDGQDGVVEETSTADPNAPTPYASFIPSAPFPAPLSLTSSTTEGADVIGTPIPFLDSLEIDDERTHYGTGYFIYETFPKDPHNVSRPLTSWQLTAPSQAVLDDVARAGEDISPTTPDVTTISGTTALASSVASPLFDLTGPAMLRELELTVPAADADSFGAATLRVTWDGRVAPSIDAPIALFFGAGSLFNRANAEYLVKAFPVNIHFIDGMVKLAVYFPMPFFRTAHVEIVATAAANVSWIAKTAPYSDPSNWAGYFHATYVDQGAPSAGNDLVMLDTTAIEGGGDWCGSVVGTSFTFSDQAALGTLEGDPRFFFDDSQTPQVQGTGTEEWGGGGDYWNGGQITTLPFYGHPVGAPDPAHAANGEDMIESAYRFLLADLMPFGKNARVQLEHGGLDDSVEHYRTLVDWYGLPGACLAQTDALHVSDPIDEQAHDYVSPDASPVDTLTTRYEWGVDHVGATEIYPATTDTGRHTTGTTELSLTIRPENFGVLLRRKLDYGYPDQAARVSVANESGTYVDAGVWYLAGSNQCVYSNPPGELDAPAPSVEASNRQWRDDEFLIPRALTDGRSRIRVRIAFSPRNAPLAPAVPLALQAWSEYRYTAYVWTLPPTP